MELAPIIDPEQAAGLLRCTARTVEDRLRSGDLPGEKFGESWVIPTAAFLQRVNEIALEKMLERRDTRKPDVPRFAKVQFQPARRRPPEL